MDSFWGSLKADFAKKALYDLIKNGLIVAIAIGIASLSTKISTDALCDLRRYKWELLVTISSILAFIFLKTHSRFDKYRPNFPRLDFDFELVEKEITYQYKDEIHMIYKKKNVLKALKNGINVYTDKYQWTGKGNVKLISGIKEQPIVETIRKNVWQFYEIRLQKTLKRNEKITTEAIWELEDLEHKAVPFFSATIEEPTDFLKFNLSLPNSFNVREVTCETSCSIGSQKPLDSITKPLTTYDGLSCVTWEIKNPNLLYHYEIKWNMN